MTLAEALRCAAKHLAALEILETSNPHLEAELLLQHALGFNRTQLYQRLRDEMPPDKETAYHDLVWRRLCGEPTPYITERTDFCDIELTVTPAAAIPRPETELLVEEASVLAGKRLQDTPSLTIVDVGTGCGAIALALATRLPSLQIIATDISPAALALAQRNAERLGLASSLRFLCTDLLASVRQPVDIVVANLPYVRSAEWKTLPVEIRCYEPREALDGGPDGLRVIDRLLRQAPPLLRSGAALLLEIGYDQGPPVAALASEVFPDAAVEIKKDLASLDRLVIIQL
ncbi:MAG: peptide chain release factor N(5)-glutamine methyltransferase [Dehalococcoidia bacterium]|nr:MAG: peptide chain release factor N(5)-glutamine methyltransferase [Dehalococcoidia bacterium]